MSLTVGDFAPSFTARSSLHPALRFEHLAGRFIALTFIVGSAKPKSLELASELRAEGHPFDDANLMHFFVVVGETGEVKAGIAPQKPGHRVYFDKEGDIAALFGLSADVPKPITFILTPRLQITHIIRALEPLVHARDILAYLADKSPLKFMMGLNPPPHTLIPDVFEGDLRHRLVGEAKRLFLMEKMRGFLPPDSTSSDDLRRVKWLDSPIKDEDLNEQVIRRVMKRVLPELKRGFSFTPVHIDHPQLVFMSEGSRLDPMRFSEAKGLTHRRFTLFTRLDGQECEGGMHHFPEYSPLGIKVHPALTLVSSSAILHKISEVTRGEAIYLLTHLGVAPVK